MKYDWMIDVIADLETFSSANNMQTLATELAELKLIAAIEIAAKEEQEAECLAAENGSHRPH
ncbi:hypothetical protein [Cognatishimia activa]|uniref:hypothetical protein n=1 Tax=Cognatishimia activa TaxID=1715691 RepID=UPI002230A1FB|nr:hypothetical protein [Cognatishimia activa]UZD90140.1 hypothetical protein M0D42_11150 [Cognatishimia activa]